MRTFIVIVIGVVLALVFDRVAAMLNRDGVRSVDGRRAFIGAWLVFAVADFAVGVAAGHGALLELAIHALVFAVPAGAAVLLGRRRPPAGRTG